MFLPDISSNLNETYYNIFYLNIQGKTKKFILAQKHTTLGSDWFFGPSMDFSPFFCPFGNFENFKKNSEVVKINLTLVKNW